MHALIRKSKKTIIGIIGSAVVIVGIATVPLPGPGWLIVFAGLGILSTEFVWAQKLLEFAKRKYESWQDWLMRQSIVVKGAVILATALLVVIILWLTNCYGFFNHWLNLHQDWADSPLVRR